MKLRPSLLSPSGAGLFNFPLFFDARAAGACEDDGPDDGRERGARGRARGGEPTLVAFGLEAPFASKEENLLATCARVGLRVERPRGVLAPFWGEYALDEPQVAAVVASVRDAVRRWRGGEP